MQWGLIAALLFVLATYGVTAAVEGRRQAKDRVATSLVWVVLRARRRPAGSLAWTTVARGAKVLDGYFLTHSMAGLPDHDEPGGGVYHALVGTLEQVGLATADRRADRPADRRLPRRVRPRQARPGRSPSSSTS